MRALESDIMKKVQLTPTKGGWRRHYVFSSTLDSSEQ